MIVAITVVFLVKSPDSNFRHGIIDFNYSCDDDEYVMEEQYFSELFNDSIEKAVLKFEAAAGRFEINEKTEHLLEFSKRGNIGPYKFSSTDKNNKKELKIELKDNSTHFSNVRNNVDIKLNPTVEWDMNIDVGAAKIDMDLSKLKTKYLNIDGGASSVKIKLGDKCDYTKLDIDAGISSLYIKIPESSGCEILSESFLLGKSLSGFDKHKKGVYRTQNFDDNPKKIYINIDAAISSLKVRRY